MAESDLGRLTLGAARLGAAAYGILDTDHLMSIDDEDTVINGQLNSTDTIQDYFEQVYYFLGTIPSSEIGKFTLGGSKLGEAQAKMELFDSITLLREKLGYPDTFTKTTTFPQDFINTITDLAPVLLRDRHIEYIDWEDRGIYKTTGIAGVLGRITLRMDVTWIDFCEIVQESGMSLELNSTPCRGFCFVKQRAQQFEPNVGILPGDAVLFTCPADPVTGPIKQGDVITFDFALFEVLAVRNKYFDGNIIYRKSLLRKKRVEPDMPAIGNLVASANLEGKTKLTWDAIDLRIFSYFDYYEVHESTDGTNYFYRTKTRTPGASIDNLVPNVKYYYKVRAMDKYNHPGEFSAATETPIDDVPPAPPQGVR